LQISHRTSFVLFLSFRSAAAESAVVVAVAFVAAVAFVLAFAAVVAFAFMFR